MGKPIPTSPASAASPKHLTETILVSILESYASYRRSVPPESVLSAAVLPFHAEAFFRGAEALLSLSAAAGEVQKVRFTNVMLADPGPPLSESFRDFEGKLPVRPVPFERVVLAATYQSGGLVMAEMLELAEADEIEGLMEEIYAGLELLRIGREGDLTC